MLIWVKRSNHPISILRYPSLTHTDTTGGGPYSIYIYIIILYIYCNIIYIRHICMYMCIYAPGPATPPPPPWDGSHILAPYEIFPLPPPVVWWGCGTVPLPPCGVVGVWYGMLGMYGVYGRSGMACLESMVCLVCMVGMVCMAWVVGIVWMVGMVCKSVGYGMFDMTVCMVCMVCMVTMMGMEYFLCKVGVVCMACMFAIVCMVGVRRCGNYISYVWYVWYVWKIW